MNVTRVYFVVPILGLLAACASLVAPYDATFDQSLNKLSEDTARFLAAASTGGPERSFNSQATVAYYATTYNVLDRLNIRARAARGSIPCGTDAALKVYEARIWSKTVLPEDYEKFDCLESQLYSIRFFANQLEYLHETGSTLKRGEASGAGTELQGAIMGAIETFVTNKPPSKGST